MEQIEGVYKGPRGRGIILIGGGGGYRQGECKGPCGRGVIFIGSGLGGENIMDREGEVSFLQGMERAEGV